MKTRERFSLTYMNELTPTQQVEQFWSTERGLGTGYYQAKDFALELATKLEQAQKVAAKLFDALEKLSPEHEVVKELWGLNEYVHKSELARLENKLDFLESKGLTVGMMKTSDKPEPYLVYVCKPDSEFDNTIHVNKLIDSEIENNQFRKVCDSLAQVAESLPKEFNSEHPDAADFVDNSSCFIQAMKLARPALALYSTVNKKES